MAELGLGASLYGRHRFYEGAGTGSRLFGLPLHNPSARDVLSLDQRNLLARSRSLIRNNPLATSALEKFAIGAVGKGITMHPNHPDRSVRTQISEAWARSSSSIVVGQNLDFCGAQTLAATSYFQDGELFILRRRRGINNPMAVPLQVQFVESEQCPINYHQSSGRQQIRNGIELRTDGDRFAYHMYSQHPGESFVGPQGQGFGDTRPVPADQVCHLYLPMRVSQLRGVPRLAPAIVLLQTLDESVDVQLVAQKVGTWLSYFVTRESERQVYGEELDPYNADRGNAFVEAGAMLYLEPGEKVEVAKPPDMGANYLPFLQHTIRMVSSISGITYEMLTGDLKGVTYSSIRAGINQYVREMESFVYHQMIYQFCQPIYEWWLRQAVLAGRLNLRNFAEDPYPFYNVRWANDRLPYVNPLDDAQAHQLELQMFTDSRSGIITRTKDRPPEVIDEEIARDRERGIELGFLTPSGASAAEADPQGQRQRDPDEPDDEDTGVED